CVRDPTAIATGYWYFDLW
nr:immunoglobulin heavy chain junction region [Macaca mulatta]MOW19295.1 immunoglobulin heavy chain junction region [Macaca mulatta]MOW20699.1 immunoglobulin heavy chain junction region [Macaca mulatta]